MKIQDFEKKIKDKLIKKVKETIVDSINDQDLNSWNSLYQIKRFNEKENEWINTLVKSILSSSYIFRNYQNIFNSESEEYKILAMVSRGEAFSDNNINLLLSIKGIDDESTNNLKAIALGGEVIKDGQSIIVDKTTGLNEAEIQDAADKLTAYFTKKYKSSIEKEFK